MYRLIGTVGGNTTTKYIPHVSLLTKRQDNISTASMCFLTARDNCSRRLGNLPNKASSPWYHFVSDCCLQRLRWRL